MGQDLFSTLKGSKAAAAEVCWGWKADMRAIVRKRTHRVALGVVSGCERHRRPQRGRSVSDELGGKLTSLNIERGAAHHDEGEQDHGPFRHGRHG